MENTIKDRNSIQHLIDYLRFDFYDPETVKRISMRPITDPVAFDNFSNPNPGGVHDPVMGVSAYDTLSSCITCGLNNDNCTGHFGHIELSAPVYNPFMMNYLLKIINMKCFNCHKLRFHKKYKIYIFFKILLTKLGLIKEASMLKGLMFSTVAESNQQIEIKIREILAGVSGNSDILNVEEESAIADESMEETLENTDNTSGDRHGSFDSIITEDTNNTKETSQSNGKVKNSVKKNKKKEMSDEGKEKNELKELQKQMTNKLKSDMACAKSHAVDEIISKIYELNEKIKSDHCNRIKFLNDQNLNTNVNLKNAMSEFWKMATSKCPNCNAVNSRIKKQGNKFFQQPLSKKQKKKMANFGINPNKDALEEGTAHQEELKIKNSLKKNSKKKPNKEVNGDIGAIHEEEVEDVKDSESESEIDEALVGIYDSLKYLHPLEIKEHIKRLWGIDGDLLSLIFGNVLKKLGNTSTSSNNEKNNLLSKKFSFEISSTGPYIFFLETLIVPANRFRPENKGGGDAMYLNAQSVVFTKILNLNNEIRSLSLKIKEEDVKEGEKKVTMKDLIAKWVELQDSVNLLYDSTKVSNKKEGDKGKGIRQLIEKKHGILRMKMMGKRVNYAGRSVISPDPMISASEVGIPVSIAQKLVFPETVTKYNLDTLRQLVINGPKKHPGANLIAKENGKMISLEHVPDDYRINVIAAKLHEGKQTVYRHLLTGDALLVNRQPTLHKPSIMSHKAKVLKGENTIRLHYANCNTYNADFDGDEMNIHFLQNHIARQEAYTISNTDNQYIVPTSGKPLRGLIQDSIVSAVYLTMKDAFFTKEEYFQTVYFCLDTSLHNRVIKKICIQSPTILKPKVLYTGKQIITTVLKSLATSPKIEHIVQEGSVGINFQHSTRLNKELWGTGHHQMEGTVTVSDNELLTGVLDKNHIGNSEFGMVHSFYEVYGPEMAGELISVFGKLFIYYLQYFHGFTCGVQDIILKEEFNLKRRRDIEDIIISGMEGLGTFFEIPEFKLNFNNYSKRNVFTRKTPESLSDVKLLPQERQQIDKLIQSQNLKIENLFKTEDNETVDNFEDKEADEKSNELIKELREKFHETIIKDETHTIESNLDVIVKNAMNKLSSDYSKNWISKGLVKNFPKNYFAMMVLSGAKGSLVNLSQIACMLGQQELEGKRVPRMASGRTLPSFEPFDANPRAGGFVSDRFSTGIRPQEFFFHCMAGREGLIDTAVKTSRSGYLQRCLVKHLEQLMVNYDYTVRDTDGNIIQFLYGEDSIDTINTRYLTNFKFIANNMDTYFDKFKPERFVGKIDTNSIRKVRKNFDGSNDTLLNKFEPWQHLGSISDKVYENMIKYMEKNPDKLFGDKESNKKENNIEELLNVKKSSKNSFKTVVFSKYLNSLVQPGESVGILAAQSIGEPSTQMTLNTFHLAGHGGVNMTLGIPRLREILMTSAENIKTPIMILPCVSNNIDTIKKLARHFEKYLLIDIIKQVSIKQKIDLKNKQKFRKYLITIKTEDFEAIRSYFYYNEEELLKILKINFIPTLVKCIAKQTKQLYKNAQIIVNKVTSEGGKKGDDDDEKEENEADYESKRKHPAKDESDDESNDENDYEDVEGTKNKKKVKDDTEENYTDTEDKNDSFEDDADMNVDEDDNKKEEVEDSEEESEGQDIKIEAEEDNEEAGEEKVKTKQKTVDDLIKEKNYSYEEVRVENMLFEFDKATFCFELYVPFNQKNLLLKNLLDQVFKKINFKSVEKVKKCHILERKRGDGKEHILQLEGINFKEAVKFHEYLDLNRIYTNDIGNILKIYGIEACRAAIVKEINAVFESYNITVDNRHLGLIADYITQQGKYRTFNRKGISTSSSPFLKMTYETTMDFLIQSCMSKEVDDLKSASSRIALGQVPQFGTGSFSLLQNATCNK